MLLYDIKKMLLVLAYLYISDAVWGLHSEYFLGGYA